MSRTLSSNVSSGKAGSTQVIYLLRFYGRLISSGGPGIFQYATKPTTSIAHWTGTTFEGNKLAKGGLDSINRKIDLSDGGGNARIGDFAFRVLNQGDIWESSFRLYTFENQDVELRVVFDDPDDASYASGTKQPSWDNALSLFKGQISRIDLRREYIEFKCQDYFVKIHRDLPQVIFSEEDFPNLPEGLINQRVPLQYGSMGGVGENYHKKLIKGGPFTTTYPYSYGNPGDFAKAFYIGEGIAIGSLPRNLVLASHDLVAHRKLNNLSIPFISSAVKYDSQMKGFYRIQGSTSLSIFDGDYYFSSVYIEGDNPQIKQTIPRFNDSSGLSDNSELNAIDEDIDNWTKLIYAGANAEWVEYIFEDSDDIGTLKEGQEIDLIMTMQNSGTVDDKIKIEIMRDGQVLYYTTLRIFQNEYIILTINESTAWYNDSLAGIVIRISYFPVSTPDSGGIQFKNIYAETYIFENVGENDEFFVAIDGRPAGAWAASFNGISFDQLIQNPAHTIASILIDELEQTASNINITQFDNIATVSRIAHKTAFSLTDKISSNDLIRQVCRENGLIYMLDCDGKHSLIPIKTGTSGGTITSADIMRGTFELKRQDIQYVYSEFIVNYKKNYGSGEYEKQAYAKSADQAVYSSEFTTIQDVPPGTALAYWTKCRTIYTRYNSYKNVLEVNCDTIRDEDTADELLKWLIDLFAFQPYLVTYYANMLNALDLEIGDLRLINYSLLPTGVSNSSIFMLVGITTEPEGNNIRLDWQELPSTLN